MSGIDKTFQRLIKKCDEIVTNLGLSDIEKIESLNAGLDGIAEKAIEIDCR